VNHVRRSLEKLPDADATAHRALSERAAQVLRPAGALARLDELAVWIGAWQARRDPRIDSPAALLFAADHGVASDGVSAYPAEVTAAMLAAFHAGRSTLDALARSVGASVAVHDVGVGRPTANLRHHAAMTADGFATAFSTGRDAVRALDPCVDLLVVGEMGIGNTTSAAAICARLLGGEAGSWVGRGTGVDDERLRHKICVVEDAVARTAALDDPLEIFRELGGHELAAMAGAFIEARHRRLPVLLDGFVATAAILPLWCVEPAVLEHCRAAHASGEQAHARVLARLGLAPLLDLGMRLGEGSGAMAAVPLVAMACRALVDVPTFGEWFGPATA
jgi:nicotinate-nucleotide--dimethylbenzimidazole phosphoribosyltransferase